MANQEQLKLLKQGSSVWNAWRNQHPEVRPDLSRANLSRANLSEADLSRADLREANLIEANLKRANLKQADLSFANLSGADLREANLSKTDLSFADLIGAVPTEANLSFANLSGADLREANLSKADLSDADLREANLSKTDLSLADLSGADLSGADLSGADLSNANLNSANLNSANLYLANLYLANLYLANLSRTDLSRADLTEANLTEANLTEANLTGALLVRTSLSRATLTACRIYGISVWSVQSEGTRQENLVITDKGEPTITLDNLKVAQFIHLLLNNEEIRDVIDTIAKKAILILGRFTPERKATLDVLRKTLRKHDYLPILFDFEKPSDRSYTETIRTLAHLARFVIADLTDSSSIPQELQAIVPTLAVPIQPILLKGKKEYSMFVDFKRYPWVLPIHYYESEANLLASLEEHIIDPAEQRVRELEI